jgi:hypothetical protein
VKMTPSRWNSKGQRGICHNKWIFQNQHGGRGDKRKNIPSEPYLRVSYLIWLNQLFFGPLPKFSKYYWIGDDSLGVQINQRTIKIKWDEFIISLPINSMIKFYLSPTLKKMMYRKRYTPD